MTMRSFVGDFIEALPRWGSAGVWGHIVGAIAAELDTIAQRTAYAVRAQWPIPTEQPDALLDLHGKRRQLLRNAIVSAQAYATALTLAGEWQRRRGTFTTIVDVIANLYYQAGPNIAWRIMDGRGAVARIVWGSPANVWYPWGTTLYTMPLDNVPDSSRYTGIAIVLATTTDATIPVTSIDLDVLAATIRPWVPPHIHIGIFAGGGPARRPLNWISDSNPVIAAAPTYANLWAQGLSYGQIWALSRSA